MTMTEIEARGKIKYRIANEMRKAGENKEEYEDLEIALQVMKEIREYREIGLTPELIEAMQGHNIAMINDLKEYQEIGTVEEFKALRNASELWEHNNNLAYKQGRIDAIDEFYDEVLNFEDYIEPVGTSGFGAVLLYSGVDITNMIVKIDKKLKGGATDECT